MPDEFIKEHDVIKSQVLQYGFITGWDYVISGCGGTLAGPPETIMMDADLSDAYMRAFRCGMSNAVDTVREYYKDKKDRQQGVSPYVPQSAPSESSNVMHSRHR